MEFKVGQEVKFKDRVGQGTIVGREGVHFLVEDETGFSYPFEPSELIPLAALEVGAVAVKDAAPVPEKKPAQQEVDRLVIDLHSQELLDSTHGMTRYDILNYQLKAAQDTLKEAKRRRVPKVLLIHGVGTGRLRDEVHQMLEKSGGLEYYFADFADGGYGATEVRFRVNS